MLPTFRDNMRWSHERLIPVAAGHHKRPAKNARGDDYATFETALKQVLSVSHSEVQSRVQADKRKRRTRRASVSRAAND